VAIDTVTSLHRMYRLWKFPASAFDYDGTARSTHSAATGINATEDTKVYSLGLSCLSVCITRSERRSRWKTRPMAYTALMITVLLA